MATKRRTAESLALTQKDLDVYPSTEKGVKGRSVFSTNRFSIAAVGGPKRRFIFSIILLLLIFFCGSTLTNSSARGGPPSDLIVRRTSNTPIIKVPEENKHTFYVRGKMYRLPIVRALRSLGWQLTMDSTQARFLWSHLPQNRRFKVLKRWQRFNQIAGSISWNRKDSFAAGFHEHKERNPNKNLYFVPETYTLGIPESLDAFEKRLKDEGGLEQPWVLKVSGQNGGMGITMLASQSEELRNVTNRVREDIQTFGAVQTMEERLKNVTSGGYRIANAVIQPYICNELTWFGTRKFDLRMYWVVISIDPLIVMYTDGYARVGNANYDETDFRDTRKKLTAMTNLAEESKGTIDEYKMLLNGHYKENAKALQQKFKERDPYQHIRNQMKEAIAETVVAFKDQTFGNDKVFRNNAQNAFALYGADFILDNNLDIWYLEPQFGPALIEDYDFRVKLHRDILRKTFQLAEEVQDKLEANPKGNVFPLNTDIKGWDVVYAGDWMYQYDEYKREDTKQRCNVDSTKLAQKPKQPQQADDDEKDVEIQQ